MKNRQDSRDDRMKALLRLLGANVASLRSTCETLKAELEDAPLMDRSETPGRLFDVDEIADCMEAVLLAWSCDPKRAFERGFDLWDRRALVDLMTRSLQERGT